MVIQLLLSVILTVVCPDAVSSEGDGQKGWSVSDDKRVL